MEGYPLISAIMPTRNRRAFVTQAIKYFQAQDYPNKELIIIEDGEEYNALDCVDIEAVTYRFLYPGTYSIGLKRNFACDKFAHGSILCHWDDDDYFGSQRLSRQVQPLLEGIADVVGLRMSLMLQAHDCTLWRCSDQVHDALFGYGVRCGTLMYRAEYFRDGLRYEDSSRGEDVKFLEGLLARDARLSPIVDPASYVCVRHGSNVTDGLDCADWERVPMERYLSEDDRVFYEQLRSVRV